MPHKPVTMKIDLKFLATLEFQGWFKLGIMLGLTVNQLKAIEYDYERYGLERLRIEMFTKWLRVKVDASYPQLIKAFMDIEEVDIASQVYQHAYGRPMPTTIVQVPQVQVPL